MLETFEATDKINAKSKGKKIIFQKLRKELLGQNGDNTDAFEPIAYAHESFMDAWKNDVVVYTGAPWVEDIVYVEPKVQDTNVESILYYRDKITTDLGISFLTPNNKGSFASAQINIKELMKMINKISEQLEDILKKWYKVVLEDNDIDLTYCPNIKVIDSELLETELKIKLVDTLYSKLNCSLRTAYEMLNVNFDDEKQKRKKENDDKIDEVFTPRMSIYTNNGDNSKNNGRPQDDNSKDPNKQQVDIDRRKAKEGI
jgi:hypothetical protein